MRTNATLSLTGGPVSPHSVLQYVWSLFDQVEALGRITLTWLTWEAIGSQSLLDIRAYHSPGFVQGVTSKLIRVSRARGVSQDRSLDLDHGDEICMQ